jgi:hypothetical protein
VVSRDLNAYVEEDRGRDATPAAAGTKHDLYPGPERPALLFLHQ